MNQIKEFFEYIFNAIKIWVIVQPWEQGLRVRAGKKKKLLYPGIYFRIPYLDAVYVQEVRLRMISLSIQTITTADGQTLTINSSLGYLIEDIEKMYDTLFHPEGTISDMAMSETSSYVFSNKLADINPSEIEKAVLEKLSAQDYGIKFKYFRLTNFAAVKTFRLIQDHQSWIDNTVDMTNKR